MTAITRFVAELKRRKVVRVAAVYAVVAWALIQVADVVLPRLALPDWTITLVVVLALFGFPVAVVLAWALDVTPNGVRRADPAAAPAGPASRAVILASVGTLAALVGFGSYAALGPSPGETEAAAVAERSIAVLPFANVSGIEENEYFSDGITEDILTRLAWLGDLRVISRTSVMTYKASELTVPEIAAELGVRYVLEGSVRRVDDRVRITGQLIDARTDEHLWAESYDRTVTDVLALQGEMAAEIARALAVELSPEEARRLEHRPTTSGPAYDLYLKGRDELRADWWRRSGADWAQAVTSATALFRRALAEDSAFAPAYVGLSGVYLDHPELPDSVWMDSALAYARRAIELDPELPDAYVQLGMVYLAYQPGDMSQQAAYDHFRTALRLNPNHAEAYLQLGFLAEFAGRTMDAIRNYKRAVTLDPSNRNAWTWLGWRFRGLGFYRAAGAAHRRASLGAAELACELGRIAVSAGDTAAAREHVRALLASSNFAADLEVCAYLVYRGIGEYRTAEEHLRRYIASIPEESRRGRALQLAFLTQRNGQPEETERLLGEAEAWARALLEESPEHPVPALTDLARVHLLRGEYDEAVTMLEEAERADSGLRFFADLSGDWFEPLRGRPRFDALMARLRAEHDSLRAQVEREGLHR